MTLQYVKYMNQCFLPFQTTECEIFLSLLVKFLDPEKPSWQRCLALEVLHKLSIQPELIRYDNNMFLLYILDIFNITIDRPKSLSVM